MDRYNSRHSVNHAFLIKSCWFLLYKPLLLYFFELFRRQIRREVDDKGQHHQDGRNRKCNCGLTALAGIDIQRDGQRCGRGLQRLDKAVEHQTKAGGKQQGRRLADDTSDCQDAAGDDTVHRVWQDDGADHVPFACAQAESALAVGLWNSL